MTEADGTDALVHIVLLGTFTLAANDKTLEPILDEEIMFTLVTAEMIVLSFKGLLVPSNSNFVVSLLFVRHHVRAFVFPASVQLSRERRRLRPPLRSPTCLLPADSSLLRFRVARCGR